MNCPNCNRKVSADLLIHTNERGFTKVQLGMQCNTCKTTYKGDDFLRVARRFGAVKETS